MNHYWCASKDKTKALIYLTISLGKFLSVFSLSLGLGLSPVCEIGDSFNKSLNQFLFLDIQFAFWFKLYPF